MKLFDTEGNVLYESSAKNIKEAVTEAYEKGISLTNADLTDENLEVVDLTGVNLPRADLTNADLTKVDLTGANLFCANLTGADLVGVNLSQADLIGANLTNADLTGANLTRAGLTRANLTDAILTDAKLPLNCKWAVVVVNNDTISVGCKTKSIDDWKLWLDSDEEYETPRGSIEFKRIEASIRAHITYLEVLNQKGKPRCATPYRDGESCGHPGCLHHVTHPCENCGRIAGHNKN